MRDESRGNLQDLSVGLIRQNEDKIKMCEIILDKMDVPWRFKFMCGLS